MSEPREYGWPVFREFLVIVAIGVVLAGAYAGSEIAGFLLSAAMAGGLVFAVVGTLILISRIRHREGWGEAIAGALLVIGSVAIFLALAVVNGGSARSGGITMACGGALCLLGYFFGDVWRH